MQRFSQRHLVVAFFAAVVLLLALAAISYRSTQRSTGSAQEVAHTEAVLHHLDLLRADIAHAESDEIRRRLEEVTDRQRRLLDERVARSVADAENVVILQSLVVGASLTLLLATFWFLSRSPSHKRLEAQRETFFQVSLDMLCFAGFDGYFHRLNPAWEKTLGFTAEELMSKPHIEFVHPDDRESTRRQAAAVLAGGVARSFENRYRCKDGSYKWLLWNSVSVPEQRMVYAAARDLTERKLAEDLLRELSLTDELTKLRNRRGFLLLAEQELKLVRDRRRTDVDVHVWLVSADLDGLKLINDQLGHEVGSEAIVHAADILRKTFRESDVIARLGGDQFAILALNNEPDGGASMCARVEEAVRALNVRTQLPYSLSLSLGIVKVDTERAASIEAVLKEADDQMYEHKRAKQRLVVPVPFSTQTL